MSKHQKHLEQIVDQFSRQAIPFAQISAHMDAMELLLKLSGVHVKDTVLDVACGPGLVACEFARHAAHVTGIDITAAMIDQARIRQTELGFGNITWQVGDAVPLPFPDDVFSLVITRYSFHHFLEPTQALQEMIRVCQPGGQVMVADVAVASECSMTYDHMEIMRDPSHTHALTEPEFVALFADSGLTECRRVAYPVHVGLEALLNASFPNSGDKEKVMQMVRDDIGINALGINARMEDDILKFTFPIAVFIGKK